MRRDNLRPTTASIVAQSRHFECELAVITTHQPKSPLSMAQPPHSATFSRSGSCPACVHVLPADCRHESIVVSSRERRIDGRLPALCCPRSLSLRSESDLCFRNHQPTVFTENSRLIRRSSQAARFALRACSVRFSIFVMLANATRFLLPELFAHGTGNFVSSKPLSESFVLPAVVFDKWNATHSVRIVHACRGVSSTNYSVSD